MTSGFLALLDDVLALTKFAAASVDDISAQVAETSAKVSGIVIDDAAVTPKYVVGLDPKRELTIIYHITKKSLINKLFILGPIALILGFILPWIIQPLLMVGGIYLCHEGYEKVHSVFTKHKEIKKENLEKITPEELEKIRIDSAIRTDFILSAEIIAITYASVSDEVLVTQIVVMLFIAFAITILVYGFVGLVVKADDVGLHLTTNSKNKSIQRLGREILKFMPPFLIILSYIGTAAMLLVGAEIIAHGIPFFHHSLHELKHTFSNTPALAWTIKATICIISGIVLGFFANKIINIRLT